MSARRTRRSLTVALAAAAIGLLGACDRRSTVPKPKTEPTAPAAPAPSASTPLPLAK